MKKGYADAITLAAEKLETLNPDTVCRRTGAAYTKDEGYTLPWLGKIRRVSEGTEVERVLWLHYLTTEGTASLSGRQIAFREIRGAGFYECKFEARALKPIIKSFGEEPELLIKAGEKLGGRQTEGGDAAVTLDVFPHLPVTYIVWGSDDEMSASGQILFDSTAPGWLPTEDLVVAASLAAYELAGALK